MHDARRLFTVFSSPVTSGRHRGTDWTLEELAAAVRDGTWADKIRPIRALARHKNEKDETGKRKSQRAAQYSELKETTLRYAVLSGTWDLAHRHADSATHAKKPCEVNGLIEPSGLRLLDLDDVPACNRAAIKIALDDGALPWAAACWLSPGGDGLHLVALLEPAPTCQAESHAAFAALLADLADRLPDAKAASDASAKNLMRPSFVSHDPDARVYPDARPFLWQEPGPPETHQDTGDAPAGHGRRTSRGNGATETHHAAPGRANRLPPETIHAALDKMASGRAGHDDNHLLAVMGNMAALGYSFEDFDEWAEAAGCTCANRRARWDSPPTGQQADRPDWAIVNLAAAHYGFERRPARTRHETTGYTHREHDEDDAKATAIDASGEGLPARWRDVGLWVASQVLYPHYLYEPQSAAWWTWRDECRWEMLLTTSHEVGDRLHQHQYALAHRLRLAGADETAALVASKAWQEQVRSASSPFMAGLRQQLTRHLLLPPDHSIAVANGVLNLADDALHPHDPRGPYLITAVANGAYLPESIEELRREIDHRLAPAIPDGKRREYLYKCLSIMLGGQGGSNLRGSLLYLLGTSGGGKGNTARVIRDASGGYAVTGNLRLPFCQGGHQRNAGPPARNQPADCAFPRVRPAANGQDTVPDGPGRDGSARPTQGDD